jgi:flagellar biogenesis protein FliO
MRNVYSVVIGVALAATAMTPSAFADAAVEKETAAVAAEPSPLTALPVRHDKPLSLEPAPSGSSLGAKFALFALVAAGGIWAYTKRAKKAPLAPSESLTVLRRTTIGVRSELLVVELEGQRMLIGVTPSSMQTLYILPERTDEEVAVEAHAERRVEAHAERRVEAHAERRVEAHAERRVEARAERRVEAPAERRIATLLEARIAPREGSREPAKGRARAVVSTPVEDSILEGQAAGLRTIGNRR